MNLAQELKALSDSVARDKAAEEAKIQKILERCRAMASQGKYSYSVALYDIDDRQYVIDALIGHGFTIGQWRSNDDIIDITWRDMSKMVR